jgi:WD40 repeat protein
MTKMNRLFKLVAMLTLATWLVYALPGSAQTQPSETRTLEISPNGNWIAAGNYNGQITLLNSSGQPVSILRSSGAPVLSVSWSPDGLYFASGDTSGLIQIWNSSIPGWERDLGNANNGIVSVRWSPNVNRNWLLVATQEGDTQVWDVNSNTPLRSVIPGETLDAAWSPQADYFVTAGIDSEIWDATNGNLWKLLDVEENSEWEIFVDWNPINANLVVTSAAVLSTNQYSIHIRNINAGLITKTLQGHSDLIHAVKWSPDGSYIASTSDDKTVKIWDASTGMLDRDFQIASPAFALDWTNDSTQIIYYDESEGTLKSISVAFPAVAITVMNPSRVAADPPSR